MTQDTKMLQAILDGQKALADKIDKVDKKVDVGFKNVNERLDKQGSQLAYLEDDAPTSDEFKKLKKRVVKLESVVYK